MGCPEKGHRLSKDCFELKRTDGAVFRVQVCRSCGMIALLPEELKYLDNEGVLGEKKIDLDRVRLPANDPRRIFPDDDDGWRH